MEDVLVPYPDSIAANRVVPFFGSVLMSCSVGIFRNNRTIPDMSGNEKRAKFP